MTNKLGQKSGYSTPNSSRDLPRDLPRNLISSIETGKGDSMDGDKSSDGKTGKGGKPGIAERARAVLEKCTKGGLKDIAKGMDRNPPILSGLERTTVLESFVPDPHINIRFVTSSSGKGRKIEFELVKGNATEKALTLEMLKNKSKRSKAGAPIKSTAESELPRKASHRKLTQEGKGGKVETGESPLASFIALPESLATS